MARHTLRQGIRIMDETEELDKSPPAPLWQYAMR